jgi:hypothetical protein
MIIWLNYPLMFVLWRLAGRFAAKRGSRSRSAPVEKSGKSNGQVRPASWSSRLGRLARTVRERREYRELLTEAARQGTILVELRSGTETRAWLSSIGAQPDP